MPRRGQQQGEKPPAGTLQLVEGTRAPPPRRQMGRRCRCVLRCACCTAWFTRTSSTAAQQPR